MHYLLTYRYTADYLERRSLYRNAHLQHAWAAQQRGELIAGGAVGDPPDAATVIFSVVDPTLIERFVQGDPYFQNGLVRSYTIQPWITVVGDWAASPIRPE